MQGTNGCRKRTTPPCTPKDKQWSGAVVVGDKAIESESGRVCKTRGADLADASWRIGERRKERVRGDGERSAKAKAKEGRRGVGARWRPQPHR